jgi:hypothetical protein
MGFAPFNRAVRSAGNRYPGQNAGRKKTPKTGHYSNEKCFGSSIFLKTERVAATRRFFCERAASRNGFVSDVWCYAAK